jgi:probable O-glycosylation ligase (exosortase A-associated)
MFTILSGGGARVYGPAGTYIEENNALGVALIMTVPMLRFLQTQLKARWQRWAMTGAMVLCGASILGSHSRGALLAISTMLALLWWRGKNKLITAVVLVVMGGMVLSMMPSNWWERMETLQTYEQDQSAMGRLHAWEMAYNVAKDRITGAGFAMWRPDVYARYKPDAVLNVTAHSIYFHMLGEHGFIGLGIYLMFWISTWRTAGWLRKQGKAEPQLDWCLQLGSMVQVALAGFAVGGAFLSLAYYDFPLNLMVLVAAARWWVASGSWKTEPKQVGELRLGKLRLTMGDKLAGLSPRPGVAAGRPQARPA